MIFLVSRPYSGDIVGMTNAELGEDLNIPDHVGLDFKVEMAFPEENHACEALVEVDQPLD